MYDMLEEAETKGHAHIISWCNGGRAFKIHKPDHMIQILKGYFYQTKYKSFLRQLQSYGFIRVTKGEFRGMASHPLLIQGRRGLCVGMKRRVSHKPKRDDILLQSQSSLSTSTLAPRLPLSSQQSLERELYSTTGAISVTPQGVARRPPMGSMPTVPLKGQESQNLMWLSQFGSFRNLGQDSTSNQFLSKSTISPISNSEGLKGCRMPLPPNVKSIITQESASTPSVLEIVGDIEDGLYDYFTQSIDATPYKNRLTTMPTQDTEDEDYDWVKGITYEGADIVLEPEKFAMTLPPDQANLQSDVNK
jgi:hypothetical protein